jgi:hypothetical protein
MPGSMLMRRFADELGVNHLRSARSPRDAALLLASRFVRIRPALELTNRAKADIGEQGTGQLSV